MARSGFRRYHILRPFLYHYNLNDRQNSIITGSIAEGVEVIEEQHIFAVRKSSHSRKSWICSNGKLGTVEEVARDHYVGTRGFRDCLIDSACVYGGLAWMLFHDILFHNNVRCRQPLCSLYLHTPKKFFERHGDVIEERLAEYRSDRSSVFARQMLNFRSHPFFTDPASRIAKYHGSWMIRNCSALADFASMSVEHGQEELIREIIRTSTLGRNAGWPDLVAWSETALVFAEVKSTDSLSDDQYRWIADHQGTVNIEIIRVIDGQSNNAIHTDGKFALLHSSR